MGRTQRLGVIALLVLLTANLSAALLPKAAIVSISPAIGSLYGGTLVLLRGSGFSRGGEEGSTTVFFGTDVCTTIDYYSTDTQIMCLTPPNLVNGAQVAVTVELLSVSATSFAACQTNCKFTYVSYRTPTIRKLPVAAVAGELIAVAGTIYGGAVSQYDIKIGNYRCVADEDDNTNPVVQYSDGAVWCRVGDQPPGYHQLTMSVTDTNGRGGYGNAGYAFPVWSGVPNFPSRYTTAIMPLITSLSYNVTGRLGGAVLRIDGHGFSLEPTDITVTAGGAPCRVQSASLTRIECIPDAVATVVPDNGGLRPGTPGSVMQVYNGVSQSNMNGLWNLAKYPASPNSVLLNTRGTIVNNGTLTEDLGDMYGMRITGYFLPPVTGTYQFLHAADDYSVFKLSTNANPANLRTTTTVPQYSWHYWLHASQTSAPLNLTAGVPYYYQLEYVEWLGLDWVKLAARLLYSGGTSRYNLPAEVQQYSSFAAMQGVTISTTVVRETQTVTITGVASGNFMLAQGTKTTTAIPWPPNTGVVGNAVAAMTSTTCSSIGVSRANVVQGSVVVGYTLSISWNCVASTPQQQLTVVNSGLVATTGKTIAFSSTRTAMPSKPLGGTFRLGMGSEWTVPISITAGTDTITLALQALSMLDIVVVNTEGNNQDYRTLTIEMQQPAGPKPLLLLDASGITGDGLSNRTWHLAQGSYDLFMDPIPATMLRTPSPAPTIEVQVNGFAAACGQHWTPTSLSVPGPCAFYRSDAVTPTVTSVTPTTVQEGDLVHIYGSKFSRDWLQHTVTIGTAPCYVRNTSTTDHLQCILGAGSAAADLPPHVVVTSGAGLATVDASARVTITGGVSLPVTADAVLEGSMEGGILLMLNGTGLSATSITVGNAPCTAVSWTFHAITCRVPACVRAASASDCATTDYSAPVAFNGVAVSTLQFTYRESLTPIISSISPLQISDAVSTTITFTGQHLCAAGRANCGLDVTIGNRACAIQPGATNTQFTCFLVRVPTSDLVVVNDTSAPSVTVASHGTARIPAALMISHGFSITRVTPHVASLMGGFNITIEGIGLAPAVTAGVQVTVAHSEMDPIPCYVVSSSHTKMVCTLATFTHCANMSLVHVAVGLVVNRITAVCNDTAHGCIIDLSEAITPRVTSVAPAIDGVHLVVYGQKFTHNAYVLLGSLPCVTDTTNTSALVCALPVLTAQTLTVYVHVPGVGCSLSSATYTWGMSVLSVSSTVGSTAGGDLVVITGTGFSSNSSRMIVSFGNGAATILSSAPNRLVVRSAALAAATTAAAPASVTVKVTLLPPDASESEVVATASGHIHASTAAVGLTLLQTTPIIVTAASQYKYNASIWHTPTLSSVSPTTGSRGTTITLVGSGFQSTVSTSSVVVNGVACQVLTWTATTITCRVANSPAGTNPVQVFIAGKGLASCGTVCSATRFTSILKATAIAAPSVVGVGGGTTLTIAGYGFGPTSVFEVCGLTCTPIFVAYDRATCRAPAWVSPSSLAYFKGEVLPYKLSGIFFAAGCCNGYQNGAVDGDLTTTSSFSTGQRGIGLRMDYLYKATLKRFRYFPAYGRAAQVKGGLVQASTDGITYVTLLAITDPHEGWNSLDIPGIETFYHFFRYSAPNGMPSPFAEIEFWGYSVLLNDAGGNCQVRVNASSTTGAAFSVAPRAFNYSIAATPRLYSVSPNNGSSLGGTLLTLHGANFPVIATANLTVMIDGVSPCIVQSASANTVTCRTTQRKAIASAAAFQVTMPGGAGRALQNSSLVPFRYLDRWSDPNTWDAQEPPVDGDTVVVPAGQTLLMDISPPRLFVLLVQGVMVFDRKDLALDATYIWVQGGKLEIGTEAEPFLNRAVITMHGDRHTTIELPEMGAKVLSVTDRVIHEHNGMAPGTDPTNPSGVLDIHGAPRLRVWTKLSSTAAAGDTVLHLEDDVDFQPGESLVLSGSEDRDGTEQVVVKARLTPRTIQLTVPLRFTHRVLRYKVPQGTGPKHEGQTIFMTCEVGLLSRNVVFQGDELSSKQLFGAHTMAVHGGLYRVENAEFRRCGQSFVLGRYCIHYHMANAQQESYVRANSIHHSFQRAVTTHGTHFLRVTDNVAYDITGHAFFIEDGGERQNTLEGNLGVYISPSAALLRSDEKPAVFWTSTPTNFWRNNVAAGSTHFGFWFELPNNPGGPSYTPDICPANDFVGEFRNNTAHGNGQHGMRVYPQYFPRAVPCDANSGPSPAFFHNVTSYWNGGSGLFVRNAGDVHFVGFRLLENSDDEIFWEEMNSADPVGLPHVIDALLVSTTEPRPVLTKKRAIWTPQQDFFYGAGLSMVNYGDSGAISSCAKCDDQTSLRQGGNTIRWADLRWVNTTRRMRWTSPFKDMHVDLDGTLTGQRMATTLVDYPHNRWPECINAGAPFDNGMLCNSSVVVRKLVVHNTNPSQLDWRRLQVAGPKAQPASVIAFRPKEYYGWVVPVVSKRSYGVSWDSPVDFQSSQIKYSRYPYVMPGEGVILTFPFTDTRWQYQAAYITKNIPYLTRMPTLANQHGSGYINQVNKTWSVVLNTINATAEVRSERQYEIVATPIQCPPYGCNVPDPATNGGRYLWSVAATWASGKVPVAGEDVTIPSNKIVVLDVVTPQLGDVVVNGGLEFEDPSTKAARELHAASLTVWGSLTIGTVAAPYQGSASIVLYGTRTSRTVVVDNSLFLGNKVLVVLGSMTAVGSPVGTTWTKLAATVASGASQLTFPAAVTGWKAGDKLVLSSTHFNASKSETAVIASVAADGRTVTLTKATTFEHVVASVTYATGRTRTFAGIVGHTTRNIRIAGSVTNAAPTYGGHLYVGRVGTRIGSVYLQHITFENCGKDTSEHSAVEMYYPTTPTPSPVNVIRGCSFVNNFNYGVLASNTPDVVIDENVFQSVYRGAISTDLTSSGATITRNAVFGVLQWASEQTEWLRPIAGLFLESRPRLMVGNLITGSADAGITVRPWLCASTSRVSWDNEVHTSVLGLFLLAGSGSCVKAGGVAAWKIAHIGIFTSNQPTNLVVQDVFVSDAHLGVSLNFFGGNMASRAYLTDAVIVATTDLTRCDVRSICRAATQTDTMATTCGSVYGAGYRHVGLVTPQYTMRARTCEVDGGLQVCRPSNMPERMCAMPWEKRHGVPSTPHAELIATNVTFVNFNMTTCGLRSVAFAHNPTQLDYTPPTVFKQSKWVNVANDAKFLLGVTDRTDPECRTACDGLHLTWVEDQDGGLLGAPGTLLPTNPGIGYPSPTCAARTSWDAQFCAAKTARAMIIENRDPDRGSRRMGPVRATRVDLVHGNRTSFSVGPFTDLCAKQFHFGQFPMAVWPGEYYELEATGSLPETLRVSFASPSSDEAVLVELFVAKPESLNVFVDGVQVTASTTLPTLASPAGAHLRDPQRRRLWFVMRGSPVGYRQFDIVRTPMIQVTLRMEVTLETFSGPKVVSNLAALLKIPASRIKIVNVRLGSVIADFEIISDKPPTANATAATHQVQQLAAVASTVVAMASNGSLQVGYPVLSIAVAPPPSAVPACEDGENGLSGTCEECGAGYYCVGVTKYACDGGTFSADPRASSASTCQNCAAGSFSGAHAAACTLCPRGSTDATVSGGQYGRNSDAICTVCPPGYTTAGPGATGSVEAACYPCPTDFFCQLGQDPVPASISLASQQSVSLLEGAATVITIRANSEVALNLAVQEDVSNPSRGDRHDCVIQTVVDTRDDATGGHTYAYTIGTDDVTVERDQTCVFAFTPVNAAHNAMVFDFTTVSVLVRNDDHAQITIDPLGWVTEGGTVEFTVRFSAPVEDTVDVSVESVDLTASSVADGQNAHADFDMFVNVLQFVAGETQVGGVVTTLQDNIVEPHEEIFALAAKVQSAGKWFNGLIKVVQHTNGMPLAVATIMDDDSSVVSVAAATVSTQEGQDALVAFTLSAPVDVDLTVTVTCAAGTAALAQDFVACASTFVLPAFSTNPVLHIATVNDAVVELDETFTVAVSQLTTRFRQVALSAGSTGSTVTITNNDHAAVSVAAAGAASEGSDVQFTASLSHPVDTSVQVLVSTRDDTAVAGSDYTAVVSTPLVFAAGTTTASFVVSTLTDPVVELEEQFQIVSGTVTSGGRDVRTQGNGVLGTATIANDQTCVLSTVAERSGAAGTSVSIQLDASLAVDGDVTIAVSSADNTAVAGNGDYTAVDSVVTLVAGSKKTTAVSVSVGAGAPVDSTFDMRFTITSTGGRSVQFDGQPAPSTFTVIVAVDSPVVSGMAAGTPGAREALSIAASEPALATKTTTSSSGSSVDTTASWPVYSSVVVVLLVVALIAVRVRQARAKTVAQVVAVSQADVEDNLLS